MKKSIKKLYTKADKNLIDKYNLGDALFQILENEHGPGIYKKILRKEDRPFEDFIYRGK
jgi:hypothetical protein